MAPERQFVGLQRGHVRECQSQSSDDTWTTADVFEAATKLTDADNKQWGIYHAGPFPALTWPMVYANGADVWERSPFKTLFHHEQQLEVFQWAYDTIHKYAVHPQMFDADRKRLNTDLNFNKGNYAMAGNSSPKGSFKTIKGAFRMQVMHTPRWEGTKNRVTNFNNIPGVVTTKAEKRGALKSAVDFVTFLSGEEAQLVNAETGAAFPVNKKAATSPTYLNEFPELDMKVTTDILENAARSVGARLRRVGALEGLVRRHPADPAGGFQRQVEYARYGPAGVGGWRCDCPKGALVGSL